MSELIAIEWEHEHVCGVQAHVTPGRVRIDRTFLIPKPVTSASSSGPLNIDWLRPELAKLGITGGDALVALPRDEAIVKRLELPEISDDEMPVMVRFQAGAKSSIALDELCLDFIPLPRRSEVPGREALMATVARQTVDEVLTVCRTAGLEPIAIGMTAAAVAEFVARAESTADNAATGASLVVARHGNRIEISMLRRGHLLFSHSARLSDEATGQEAQAIVAEVSRALVALRGAIADVKIERAWTLVSASEHEQLAESLHRRLQCEVLPLDPFASVDRDPRVADAIADRSLFAGPIGMLLAKSDPRVPALDFLSPRQPPVERNAQRQRAILAAAAAVALVAILGGYQWHRLGSLQSQIDDLKVQEADLVAALKKGDPAFKASTLVAEWEAESEDWLDEMTELAGRMPATDQVYLKSLRFEPKLVATGAPRVIKLEGFARDRDEAMKLNERFLATDDRYVGLPVAERPTSKEEKEEFYKWHFDKDIRLMSAKSPVTPARSDELKPKGPPGTKSESESSPAAKPAETQPSASKSTDSRTGASS